MLRASACPAARIDDDPEPRPQGDPKLSTGLLVLLLLSLPREPRTRRGSRPSSREGLAVLVLVFVLVLVVVLVLVLVPAQRPVKVH